MANTIDLKSIVTQLANAPDVQSTHAGSGGFALAGAVVGAVFGGPAGAAMGAALGKALAGDSSDSVVATAVAGYVASEAASSKSGDNSISSVLSSITDTVKSVTDAIKPAMSAIADTVHEITDTVRNINDNMIQPIVGPLTAAYTGISTMIEVITRDWNQGLKGILKIPQDISNAFSGIDASFQRAMAVLNAGNAEHLSTLLIPALRSAFADPVDAYTSHVYGKLPEPQGEWTPPPIVHPVDNVALEDAFKQMAEWEHMMLNPSNLVQTVIGMLFRLTTIIPQFMMVKEPLIEVLREATAYTAGHVKFDPSAVQSLYIREEITREDAIQELRYHGYNEVRAGALLDLTIKVPGSSDALTLFSHGWLRDDLAAAMLARDGWTPEDIDLLLKSSYSELDPGALNTLVNRGLMLDIDAIQVLVHRGMRESDAKLMLETMQEVVQPVDVMRAVDRSAALNTQVAPHSLSEPAPQDVRDAAAHVGLNAAIADLMWQNHYTLMPPSMAIDAWFRGYITRDHLDALLQAAGIAREEWQNVIDTSRPLVPYRVVTTLMMQGIINASDGMDILRKHGYSEQDANYLVQIERASHASASPATADTLHGLTQTTILGLFDAGTLTFEEAQALLVGLGLGDTAASSILELAQIKSGAALRAAQIATVIARAKAGLVDYGTAGGMFAELGLTTSELNKALAQLTTVLSEHTKMPSESQLTAMYKHGVLDRDAAAEALQLLGYSAGWAELLLQLAEAGPLNPPAAAGP